MAITTTQSTQQLLEQAAMNQAAAKANLLATPTNINYGSAGSPIGLISSGISTIGQAAQSPAERLRAQQLDARALEQQTYDRNQAAQAEQYQREQNALANTRADSELALRTALQQNNMRLANAQEGRAATQFNTQRAQARAQADLAATTGTINAERAKELSDAGFSGTNPNIQMFDELQTFDNQRAQGGDSFDAAASFLNTLPDDIKGDAASVQNFYDDVNDGLNQAKKGFGKTWDKQYEQLAVQRALRNTPVSGGFLGFLSGNFDEEGFRDRVAAEMKNIIDAKADYMTYRDINRKYDSRISKEQIKAARAGY